MDKIGIGIRIVVGGGGINIPFRGGGVITNNNIDLIIMGYAPASRLDTQSLILITYI